MHPRNHAAQALHEFMAPVDFGSVNLAGKEREYSDMSLTFSDWTRFYFQHFAEGADPTKVQKADVLLGLMRDEDITQYEDQLLSMAGTEGIEDLYLRAGLYDVVQRLKGWDAIRDEEITHPFAITLMQPSRKELPKNLQMCISRGTELELCRKFREFGLIGASPPMVHMYDLVNMRCGTARSSPSRSLPNLVIYGEPGSRSEKESLREAICQLSGRPKGFVQIACSHTEDEAGLSVYIPCLRDRRRDIPLLVNHYLQQFPESDLDSLRFPLALRCSFVTDVEKPDVQKLEASLFALASESLTPQEMSLDVKVEASPRHINDFSQNEDYTSVTLRGDSFLLKGRSADIIRILHTAQLSGHPDVHKERIAVELNCDASIFRVRDAFRSRRSAYEALIKYDGKGFYRLNV